MNAIDQWQQAVKELRQVKEWAALIGVPYHGGCSGGGVGIGKVHEIRGTVTIYHQSHDGAANYHELPSKAASDAMSLALLDMAPQIIAKIVQGMQDRVTNAAREAAKLVEKMKADCVEEPTP